MLSSLRVVIWVPVVVALAVVVAGCGEPLATPETAYLQAAGSMAMESLVEDLAHAFGERSPYAELETASLGTSFGLRALRADDVDLAYASWLVPAQEGEEQSRESPPSQIGLEVDPRWQVTPIARDGIAIIVHPSNPLRGVGLLQLKDLFSGRAPDWQAVDGENGLGEVQPVSREAGSGTRAAFEALVMESLPVTPRAVVMPSPQSVVDFVAEHPGAVGYVSAALTGPDVKVMEIEGEAPDVENLGQGVYPLTRELSLLTTGEATAAVREFVDFALSPAGQQIVGRHHGRVR